VSLLLRDRRGGGLVASRREMEAVLEAGGPMALSGYTRVMAKVLLPHVIYARIGSGSLEELPAEAFLVGGRTIGRCSESRSGLAGLGRRC